MCLYNHNIKNCNFTNDQENTLLKEIYNSISEQNNEKTMELTEQLIMMQSSVDKIEILQEALNKLK